MKPEKNNLSFKTHLFDKVLGPLVKGNKRILHIDEIKKAAIKKTTFSDFGDPYFEDGLNCLIGAANADKTLNNLGCVILKSALIHNLSNRLLFVNELQTNKQLRDIKLLPPIIITGLPRSGTTFLHRLLLQDDSNYGAPLWEMMRPINEPGKRDLRKIKARLEMAASNFIKGSIKHIHYTSYKEAEECVWLFGITFNALLYWIQFPLHPYIDFMMLHDRDKKYQDYHNYLRIFQFNRPDRRMLLKSPEHVGSIAEIQKNIPNAIIVETHRDPVECFNSMNSMLYNIHRSVTHYSNKTALANSNLKMIGHELKRNREFRKNTSKKIIDVWYEDLLSNPIGVVETIYQKCGMDIDESFRRRMEEYISKNPQHKHGKHHYNSQVFGFSDAEIKEKLYPFKIPR